MTADEETGPEAYPGAPRWVKIAAIIVGVLLLLVVLVLAFGPGDHGPGRHEPGSDDGGAPADTDRHTPPEGGHEAPDHGARSDDTLAGAAFGSQQA